MGLPQQTCVPRLVAGDDQFCRNFTNGENGIGLVRRMRSHPDFRDVPVILLTAKGFELDHEELKRELDIAYVVCKPFSPRELLKMVQSLLGVPVAVEE